VRKILIYRNDNHDKTTSTFDSAFACFHSFHTFILSSHENRTDQNTQNCDLICCFTRMWKLVFHANGRTQIESVSR